MHLGILQTDQVLDQFRPRYGDYPDMFEALFKKVDSNLTMTTYRVQEVAEIPKVVVCDAYIITGSRHSVYDDLPWIEPLVGFLRKVLAEGKKIVGICFGHQLMAHFFGGNVAAAEQGWAVGVHASKVVSHRWWMGESPQSTVALLSSHKDQVQRLPEGAELVLTNDFCPIAGFVVGNQVVTVQGHPEFAKGYSQDLMAMREDLLGEDVFARGVASLAAPTDEALVAEWILGFVRGGET